jgi:tellurite resistance protein TerC
VGLPLWLEIATLGVLGVMLLADLAFVARRPRAPSLRECVLWVSFYVGLALVFALALALVSGGAVAGSFMAGWLTEYSLSIDNLFVFVIIMSRFGVPRGSQQKVLMIGIIVSLVLRGACILLGAAAIERFSWVFYLFGVFLVYTAVQLARGSIGTGDEDYRENVIVRQARRLLPIAEGYDGARVITRSAGRRMLTPLVIVFLAIGSTDLLFALDSIPAIFGLTKDPFIVFTATLFALMGLRQLYFLLGGLLDRLVYLSTGLSVILGFIGIKLVLEALHTNELQFLNGGDPVQWAPVVPTWLSLAVIFFVLAVTTAASLSRSRAGHARAPQRPPATTRGSKDARDGRNNTRAGHSGQPIRPTTVPATVRASGPHRADHLSQGPHRAGPQRMPGRD